VTWQFCFRLSRNIFQFKEALMDLKDAAKKWEEICYLLSDGINKNSILEKDFESQVIGRWKC
jgi:hypothetical protein